ncbi:MAG: Holliday junction resolvase RuvX [Rhodanobacter sp.]|jgi:putative Holliday junction resolvase|nr:Holliday junction resolvase RuvX [Rhodanobacter sp.]
MLATPEGAILAFDYGTRLIGIAIGHRLSGHARALTVLANGDWARLDTLIADWQPECFVVGLPLARDGGEQPMTRAARAFAHMLERRYARVAHLVDERYSSAAAAQRFAEQRARGKARRKDAANIDALAAQIILESWLAQAG